MASSWCWPMAWSRPSCSPLPRKIKLISKIQARLSATDENSNIFSTDTLTASSMKKSVPTAACPVLVACPQARSKTFSQVQMTIAPLPTSVESRSQEHGFVNTVTYARHLHNSCNSEVCATLHPNKHRDSHLRSCFILLDFITSPISVHKPFR